MQTSCLLRRVASRVFLRFPSTLAQCWLKHGSMLPQSLLESQACAGRRRKTLGSAASHSYAPSVLVECRQHNQRCNQDSVDNLIEQNLLRSNAYGFASGCLFGTLNSHVPNGFRQLQWMWQGYVVATIVRSNITNRWQCGPPAPSAPPSGHSMSKSDPCGVASETFDCSSSSGDSSLLPTPLGAPSDEEKALPLLPNKRSHACGKAPETTINI